MEDIPTTTPNIALLLSRLQALNHEVTRNINKIVQRLDTFDPPMETPLTLLPAKHNIVDRKAEKERHKKRWKVELKDIITTPVAYEEVN